MEINAARHQDASTVLVTPHGVDDIRMYSVDTAAELMGVDRMTVYRHIWSGELAWVNVAPTGKRTRIRIRNIDLRAWVAKRLVPGRTG